MDGSLNGDPGEELACPGVVPPNFSTSWHDWLGGPVPLGLLAAQAGTAALAQPIAAAKTPTTTIGRIGLPLGVPQRSMIVSFLAEYRRRRPGCYRLGIDKQLIYRGAILGLI